MVISFKKGKNKALYNNYKRSSKYKDSSLFDCSEVSNQLNDIDKVGDTFEHMLGGKNPESRKENTTSKEFRVGFRKDKVQLVKSLQILDKLLQEKYSKRAFSCGVEGVDVILHTINGSRLCMKVFQVIGETLYLMDEYESLAVYEIDLLYSLDIIE